LTVDIHIRTVVDITTGRTGEAMTETTTYQPKFFRAGRELDRDEAIRLIVGAHAVTVAVPDGDCRGMAGLSVSITTGSFASGDSCTAATVPAVPGRWYAGDVEVYAAVMAAAASLMNDANAILLARDLA
jgi:hypothetical protein